MVKAALFDENSIKCISPICAACKSYPKIKSRLFLSVETLKCSRGLEDIYEITATVKIENHTVKIK